jgi:hypothetical protein
MPTSADEAFDTMERLTAIADTPNPALERFGASLVESYEAEPASTREHGLEAFWGSDPRAGTTACRTAVYQLSLPPEPCTKQQAFAVEAAAGHGLIVFDDENGMCFLPDGSIFPEDAREMWESALADLKAGPRDPNAPDGRTMLEKIAGAVFDEIGRGNKRL